MYEIVRLLHKSLITEEPSIKDKMKLYVEYFDSKGPNQTTGDCFVSNLPPPLPGQNCLQMPYMNMIFSLKDALCDQRML